MADLGGGNFAVSGITGVMHLLHWNPERKQMMVVRRLGAIPECHGLALNRRGQVWFNFGRWEWNADPTAPLQDCSGAGEMGQAAMLPNDSFIAATSRLGMSLETDNFTYQAAYATPAGEPPLLQASAVYDDAQGHPSSSRWTGWATAAPMPSRRRAITAGRSAR